MPPPQGGIAYLQRSPILGVPFYLCIHPLTQEDHIWRGNTYERGPLCRGLAVPHPKGAELQCSPIFGILLYLCLYPLMQNDHVWQDNTWRGVCFLGSTTPPILRGGPQYFPILGVPFYLCIHPLMQNDQIWRGNTWGGGLFLGDQPCHCPKGAEPQCSPVLGFSCCRAWTIITPYLPDSQHRHWRRYSGYCTPPLELSWTSDHATMCLPLCETCTGCRSSRGLSLSCDCSSTRHSSVTHKST